jgi:hypothetical protein
MWTKSLLVSGIFASAQLALSGSSARAESIGLQGALSLGCGGVRGIVDPTGNETVLSSCLIGLSLSIRFNHLLIGGHADGGGELLVHGESNLSLQGGWTSATKDQQVSILGEVGTHSYSNFGGGQVPGGKAALPFVGVRAVADLASREGGHAVLSGVWLTVRQDLGTETVLDASFATRGDWRVGGTSILGGVRVGFDLVPPRSSHHPPPPVAR